MGKVARIWLQAICVWLALCSGGSWADHVVMPPPLPAQQKLVFKQARTPAERVAAARAIAHSYFQTGAYFRAEWWLRRALAFAPDGQIAAALSRDIAAVRSKNPVTVKLHFSIAPNGNINNGYQGSTVTLWDRPFTLSPAARALSGLEVFGAGTFGYRIRRTERAETTIGVSGFGQSYALSEEARKSAPGVSGSDFSYSGVSAQLSHETVYATLPGRTKYRLSIARRWYGGVPWNNQLRATLRHSFGAGPDPGFYVLGDWQFLQSQRCCAGDTRIYGLGGGGILDSPAGGQFGFELMAQTASATVASARFRALRLSARYRFAHAVARPRYTFFASATGRDYPVSIYSVDGRQDLTLSAGVEAVFFNASVLGFSPISRIEYSQTRSNLQLYNRRNWGLRLGWQSDF